MSPCGINYGEYSKHLESNMQGKQLRKKIPTGVYYWGKKKGGMGCQYHPRLVLSKKKFTRHIIPGFDGAGAG